ncbi:WAP domain-containing protein [Trichonephila inaurata madagascariensis]|uniref:WAP domain-containing protein n=1 Tax=Trichonephila inaurata madagascariensis TaxID=2747483 RepID=A0A8X6XE95_9ARAC|nr:WAP domain-containing protein [Trichonephila inaurata madagascariensis]
MWNLKSGGFNPRYNLGNTGWRESYSQWDTSGRSEPWTMNSGLYWNFPAGNVKGSNIRRCFNNGQCNEGECCQIIGFSNTGACIYGGCNYQPQNFGWLQRPGNNKGEQITVAQFGRPGSCSPPQFVQGPAQYCRYDENCPGVQKCCNLQGKAVCAHAIFA